MKALVTIFCIVVLVVVAGVLIQSIQSDSIACKNVATYAHTEYTYSLVDGCMLRESGAWVHTGSQ